MTKEMKRKAIRDFSLLLDGMKMSDGKINYSRSFDCGVANKENSTTPANAVVWLTVDVYRKITTLVTGFSEEVGWHGTVVRSGDSEFVIDDIFVYPQEVTGSTVNTDQAAYTKWLYSLEDDIFNRIRMQGHSHCNMGVSPSRVDETHRQRILDQLEDDMFYIFMIWNRSLATHTLVYDMQQNVLYEDKDVEVRLIGNDEMVGFIEDAKAKVQKPVRKNSRSTKSRTYAEISPEHSTGIYFERGEWDF